MENCSKPQSWDMAKKNMQNGPFSCFRCFQIFKTREQRDFHMKRNPNKECLKFIEDRQRQTLIQKSDDKQDDVKLVFEDDIEEDDDSKVKSTLLLQRFGRFEYVKEWIRTTKEFSGFSPDEEVGLSSSLPPSMSSLQGPIQMSNEHKIPPRLPEFLINLNPDMNRGIRGRGRRIAG